MIAHLRASEDLSFESQGGTHLSEPNRMVCVTSKENVIFGKINSRSLTSCDYNNLCRGGRLILPLYYKKIAPVASKTAKWRSERGMYAVKM